MTTDPRNDDLFRAIDDVLSGNESQQSYESGQPQLDGCVRCGSDTAGGDFCQPCRAFMLGDSDHDPAALRVASPEDERWQDIMENAGEYGELVTAIADVMGGRTIVDLLADGGGILTEDGSCLTGRAAIEHVERLVA